MARCVDEHGDEYPTIKAYFDAKYAVIGIRVVVDKRMPEGFAILPERRRDETILHVLRVPPTE